jgi:hypothetical protein
VYIKSKCTVFALGIENLIKYDYTTHLNLEKVTGTPKNAEFYAYFKIIVAGLTNSPKESYAQKNYANFEYFRFCTSFLAILLKIFFGRFFNHYQQI